MGCSASKTATDATKAVTVGSSAADGTRREVSDNQQSLQLSNGMFLFPYNGFILFTPFASIVSSTTSKMIVCPTD